MAGFFLVDVYSFWLYNIVIVSKKGYNMYIEMTTFAIPTFLITACKAIAIGMGIWVALVIIVGMFYPSN